MSAAAPSTIRLKDLGGDLIEEAVAAAALSPGHVLEITSSGTVQKNATAGKKNVLRVALEDEYQGKTIADAYASGAVVRYMIPKRGDMLYLRVAAAALAIAAGAQLQTAADGTVKLAVAGSQSGTTPFAYTAPGEVVAEASEALDNSAGASEAFIRVRVL